VVRHLPGATSAGMSPMARFLIALGGVPLGFFAGLVVGEGGEELARMLGGERAAQEFLSLAFPIILFGTAAVLGIRSQPPLADGLRSFAAVIPVSFFVEDDPFWSWGICMACAAAWGLLQCEARFANRFALAVASGLAAFFGPTPLQYFALASALVLLPMGAALVWRFYPWISLGGQLSWAALLVWTWRRGEVGGSLVLMGLVLIVGLGLVVLYNTRAVGARFRRRNKSF
jgi:hypothetical protein